jgi:hypothetical protein
MARATAPTFDALSGRLRTTRTRAMIQTVVDESPYLNVTGEGSSFSLPRRKWRELLFVGALVPSGEFFVRNPERPLPPFRDPDLFPEGVRFRVRPEEGDRVRVERVD